MSNSAVLPTARLVARISPVDQVHLIYFPHTSSDVAAVTCTIDVPSIPKYFIHAVSFLRLSGDDTSEGDLTQLRPVQASPTIWLLLGSDDRIALLQLDLLLGASNIFASSHVVVDIEFPSTYGRITALDFVSGHDYALLLFDLATSATILSLTRAERDDIPDRKSTASESYALSRNGDRLALLVREKQVDRVVVFEHGKLVSSFATGTLDAQKILWSPDGKPLIAICDTAAHGMRLKFFTAMGDPLKKFDVLPAPDVSDSSGPELIDVGICSTDWKQSSDATMTMLAIGAGSRRIHLRYMRPDAMIIASERILRHPASPDSSITSTWQQIGDNQIASMVGQWSYDSFRKTSGCEDVEIVSINADGTLIASTINDCPKLVYIWRPGLDHPISVFILQHEVRQLLWDPSLPEALVVVTDEKSPCIYYWPVLSVRPSRIVPPSIANISSRHWKGLWLFETAYLDLSRHGAHYFMLSSTKFCDIGLITSSENTICWSSALEGSPIVS